MRASDRLRELRTLRQRVDEEIAALEAACLYDRCEKPSRSRGLCIMHYHRERRAGFVTPIDDRRAGGPRPKDVPCGTEERYQQHAYTGDAATDTHRVGCEPCRMAHAAHERARAAKRRARLAS